jgi:hypothetical protein
MNYRNKENMHGNLIRSASSNTSSKPNLLTSASLSSLPKHNAIVDPLTLVRNIHQLLCQPQGWFTNHQQIVISIETFLSHCDQSGSSNKHGGDSIPVPACPKELKSLFASLIIEDNRPELQLIIQTTTLSIIHLITVLLHLPENRRSLDLINMEIILKVFQLYIKQRQWKLCAEICAIIVNACHEPGNVALLMSIGGLIPLLHCIQSPAASREQKLMINALGTLQAVCYTPNGRHIIRQDEKVSGISHHLLLSA